MRISALAASKASNVSSVKPELADALDRLHHGLVPEPGEEGRGRSRPRPCAGRAARPPSGCPPARTPAPSGAAPRPRGSQRTGVSGAACQSRSTTSAVTSVVAGRARASTSTSRWKRRRTKSAIMAGAFPSRAHEPGFRASGVQGSGAVAASVSASASASLDEGRRHRRRAVLGRQLLADPARHGPHERRDRVEERLRPRASTGRPAAGTWYAAARGEAHHLALVARHELGRDHRDALGPRPLLGQPPDHAAEEHRRARDPRLGLRRPAHLARGRLRRAPELVGRAALALGARLGGLGMLTRPGSRLHVRA